MRRRKPRGVVPKLKEAVAVVTEDYVNFLHEPDPDPKAFNARHTAAKTALTHLDQLMRMTGTSDDEVEAEVGKYQDMLGDTRQEIGALPEEEDDAGEAG